MRNHLFKFFLFLFILSSFSLFISSIRVPAGNRSAESDTETLGNVVFNEPVFVEEILTLSRGSKLKVILFESDFLLGSTVIHDFYSLSSQKEAVDIESDYIKFRLGALQDMLNEQSVLSKEEQQELVPQFQAAKKLIKEGNKEKLQISKATFSGKKSELEKLNKKVKVKSVDIFDTGRKIDKEGKHKEIPKNKVFDGEQVLSLAATGTSWMPNSGTSLIGVSSLGGRFTRQYMKWNTMAFAPEDTYEHDFFLYNYDGQTYLNGASTAYPDCFPVVTYASTSWPAEAKPYLDSRNDLANKNISCKTDELSYTIGAARADKLVAGTTYNNYIRTTDGNAASDKFKLNAQLGYRTVDTCYTTWCSWSESQVFLVSAWSTIVPGTLSWTYTDGRPAAPSNVSVSDPTSSSLRVNFKDNATNETGFKVERKTGTGGTWSQITTFGILANAGNWYWINNGLASSTTYCYRLRAYNAIGDSSYSNEACGTTSAGISRSEVVVDDLSSGFTRGGSYWAEANIGYNGHMYWTYVNGSIVDSWGEWYANLDGGNYEVYAFIPSNYATTASALYQIYHSGGTTTRTVNQNNYFDVWVSLGTYGFSSGTTRRVRLTDATGETNYNLRVGFDAVKLVPR